MGAKIEVLVERWCQCWTSCGQLDARVIAAMPETHRDDMNSQSGCATEFSAAAAPDRETNPL